MSTPLAIGFCPACQELLGPFAPQCPGCDGELAPVTITDAPDEVAAGAEAAVEAGEMISFGLNAPAAHALLIADLILRHARAA